jgi:hypothetical protein
MNHAAVLHALVVAAPDDFSIEHQHRADGNAAFRQTFSGLVNRGLKKHIHAWIKLILLRNGKMAGARTARPRVPPELQLAGEPPALLIGQKSAG